MNETGILERILIRRYGRPMDFIDWGLPARGWNPDKWSYRSALYMGMKWNSLPGLHFRSLRAIYGDSIGGSLVRDTMRAALLLPVYKSGRRNIYELRMEPPVQRATVLDPAVDYFMDEDNREFYGVKRGQLYVYDVEYDDLECLGPVEPALEKVFNELADIYDEDD